MKVAHCGACESNLDNVRKSLKDEAKMQITYKLTLELDVRDIPKHKNEEESDKYYKGLKDEIEHTLSISHLDYEYPVIDVEVEEE